jgi:hypothetical protein
MRGGGGRKHSAHARRVMGSVVMAGVYGESSLRGRSPGLAEHEVVQDVHGVAAVLVGGVDVASDVEVVVGDVAAGQAAAHRSQHAIIPETAHPTTATSRPPQKRNRQSLAATSSRGARMFTGLSGSGIFGSGQL